MPSKPFQGFPPGNSVAYMWRLITLYNAGTHSGLTSELLLAICWEETLFTNRHQESGSAIGFGQTEPAELRRMVGDGSIKVDLNGMFLDDMAISAMIQMLDFYMRRWANRREALKAYAGYNFRNTPEWHANRNRIMDGWEASEAQLQALAPMDFGDDFTQRKIIEGLQKARTFDPDKVILRGHTYRELLFP